MSWLSLFIVIARVLRTITQLFVLTKIRTFDDGSGGTSTGSRLHKALLARRNSRLRDGHTDSLRQSDPYERR